jgi:hypothetical protein
VPKLKVLPRWGLGPFATPGSSGSKNRRHFAKLYIESSLTLRSKSFFKEADDNLDLGQLIRPNLSLIQISSEMDAVILVSNILDKIVRSDTRLKLNLAADVQMKNCRPDFYVLLSDDDQIVGAIEVKKPRMSEDYVDAPEADFNDAQMGQLYDYLMLVAAATGVRKLYGILTDYNYWRVLWIDLDAKKSSKEGEAIGIDTSLPSRAALESGGSGSGGHTASKGMHANVRRMASSAEQSRISESPTRASLPDLRLQGSNVPRTPAPPASDGASKVKPEVSPPPPPPPIIGKIEEHRIDAPSDNTDSTSCLRAARNDDNESDAAVTDVFYASKKCWHYKDADTVRMLRTTLWYMYETAPGVMVDLHSPITDRHVGRVRVNDMTKGMRWSLLSLSSGLRWNERPSKVCQEFYIWVNVGHGAEGCAYLASDESGRVCVVKFIYQSSRDEAGAAREKAAAEAAQYTTVYPQFDVRHELLSGRQALILPHFAAVPVCRRMEVLEFVEDTLRNDFDFRGVVHNDISWRHVGLYYDEEGVERAALFDLGDCEEKDDSSANHTKWVEDAIESLRKRAHK